VLFSSFGPISAQGGSFNGYRTFAATKKLRAGFEWNFSVDNLNNKRYYETQNFFDSRITPTSPVEARIHGTPGYPVGFATGLTWRFE
jgi:hypothetical protein